MSTDNDSNKTINIIPLSPEWFQIRSTLLTSTDIAAAVGLSSYTSPTHFYEWLCAGKPAQVFEHPEIPQAGIDAESYIANLFLSHMKINPEQLTEGTFIHNDWLGATPDRLWKQDHNNKIIIVELKLKYFNILPLLPQLEHIVQVHIQMYLMKDKIDNYCYLIYASRDKTQYRIFKIYYSDSFIAWLLKKSYYIYCKWKKIEYKEEEEELERKQLEKDWDKSYYHEYKQNISKHFQIDIII